MALVSFNSCATQEATWAPQNVLACVCSLGSYRTFPMALENALLPSAAKVSIDYLRPGVSSFTIG